MSDVFDRLEKLMADLHPKKSGRFAHFSRLTGVSRSTITEWNKRRNAPGRESLALIAEKTNTPLEWLVSGTFAGRPMHDENAPGPPLNVVTRLEDAAEMKFLFDSQDGWAYVIDRTMTAENKTSVICQLDEKTIVVGTLIGSTIVPFGGLPPVEAPSGAVIYRVIERRQKL